MAVFTADQFSQQMIAQFRLLDPSGSAEIGTPERKIIDTVAAALANNQVDLTGLSGALDIDSKYGTNLDRFTNLFGFQRQQAMGATGFVTFSSNTPAIATINVPSGTVLQSNTLNSSGQAMQYTTTAGASINQGALNSGATPVTCTLTGSGGNSGPNTITIVSGTPLPGVTSVTNTDAITGGTNQEDDNSYKVRFKNTIFRNLAGTEDQYLALAISTAFTTKANVIGPKSNYQEYIQVPDYDDAGYLEGTLTVAQATPGGVENQWTTATSIIPYAAEIYTTTATFVSNQSGATQYFYRPGVDFQFNSPPLNVGDTYRNSNTLGIQPNVTFLNVFNPVSSITTIPGLQAVAPGNVLLVEYSYRSSSSRNNVARNINNAVDIFVNGSNDQQASCVFMPLFTSAWTFTAAPNSIAYYENFRRDGSKVKRPQLGNWLTPLFQEPVDALPDTIVVNGQNYYLGIHYWLVHEIGQNAGSIRARDGIEWSQWLQGDPTGSFPYPPTSGVLAPYQPTGGEVIQSIPTNTPIEVDNYLYDANIVVLAAAVDGARQITTDVMVHKTKVRYFKLDITTVYTPTGANQAVINTAIGAAVQGYMNNQYFGSVIQLSSLLGTIFNVPNVSNVRWSNDLPNSTDLIRVLETDINGNPLHGATIDRFQVGTVSSPEFQSLYIAGAPSGVGDDFILSWNDPALSVSTTLSSALSTGGPITSLPVAAISSGMLIGSTVTVGATGYSQVWTLTSAASSGATTLAVTSQTPNYAYPLGSSVVQGVVTMTTAPITFASVATPSSGAAVIQTAIQAAATAILIASGTYYGITVTADVRPTTNVVDPLVSYKIIYGNGTPYLPTITNNITASSYTFDSDFFLLDNELPSLAQAALSTDTGGIPGMIIRPRAENTFYRPGLG